MQKALNFFTNIACVDQFIHAFTSQLLSLTSVSDLGILKHTSSQFQHTKHGKQRETERNLQKFMPSTKRTPYMSV